MPQEERKRRDEREPRPWESDEDLRIDATPEEVAAAILSGKGLRAITKDTEG